VIIVRKAHERGHAQHGWLDTYHTFSFANYYDPNWMGFRTLRVINDDLVMPGEGFGMHPHRDMEIITYILRGALEHKDSLGNGRVIQTGDIQYMAAGSGVQHSEFNPSREEPVRLLQIWILPNQKGLTPRYQDQSFANAPTGQLHLVASPSGEKNSIQIHQDTHLWLARLHPGQTVSHSPGPDRHTWIHIAEGELTLNQHALAEGDGAAVSHESTLSLTATRDTQVLLFDLN
jgi:redox-sensitive bicupin YhaK (pirin superfamily)